MPVSGGSAVQYTAFEPGDMPSDTDDPGFDEAVLDDVGTLLLVGVSIALAAIGVVPPIRERF